MPVTLPAMPRSLSLPLGIAAALAILAFAVVALARIGFDYELEFMEGTCLDHVDRVLDGNLLYVKPSVDFVPWLYGPLYFYASAAMATVLGAEFYVLRAISFASAIATLLLIALIILHSTGNRLAALVGAGLWASTYWIVGTWWDIGRVDSLFMALLFGGFATLWLGQRPRSAVAAAALLVLAYLTKQTALIPATAFTVAIAAQNPRRALWFGGALTAIGMPTMWAFDVAHDGWFWFYTWTLPRHHEYGWDLEFVRFWSVDLVRIAPLCLIGIWFILRLWCTHRRSKACFTAAWCGGLGAASALGRAHIGGAENVLIPTHAGFALLAGLALAEVVHDRGWRLPITALLLLQFGSTLWEFNPRARIPTAADHAAGDRLVEIIENTDGEVFSPFHGHYMKLAGRTPTAHWLAALDVYRAAKHVRPELAAQLRSAFLNYTWERDCELVLFDDKSFSDDLRQLVQRDPTVIEFNPVDIFTDLYGDQAERLGRPVGMPVVGMQMHPNTAVYRIR